MGYPQRIVSLVPSLTELVWALGAGDRLAGRTRFCIEPGEMAAFVPEYGGTKNPDTSAIAALGPDLVIANKEENRKEDVDALRNRGIRVVVTDPSTVRSAMEMVLQLGLLLGCEEAAHRIYVDVQAAISETLDGEKVRVFVPIWHRPLMAMGGDCYGSDVVMQAGGINVFGDMARYPEVSVNDVVSARPQLVLLPDEPYHFREEHRAEFAEIAPVRFVSGQLLWWYGPRMADSIRTLRAMLRQEVSG
jgi:ABC-type Fe3+-hydroxamate transport system substrate-binding protein